MCSSHCATVVHYPVLWPYYYEQATYCKVRHLVSAVGSGNLELKGVEMCHIFNKLGGTKKCSQNLYRIIRREDRL